MTTVVHVIERFTGGGPERALLTAVRCANRAGLEQRHIICALEAAASPFALLHARRLGVIVYRQPEAETLRQQLAGADVVVLHFWNNPAVYEFLRGDWPATRLLLWATVYGHQPPQIILPELVNFADRLLVKTPGSLRLPPFFRVGPDKAGLLYSPIDADRLQGFTSRAHNTFNVGYIGTMNFTKMHPRYVPMSAAVDVANARFIVVGGGPHDELTRQVRQLGVSDRFDFRGHVEDIRSVLETLDVFGYPLCEDTYAASELALLEAMWVGVPPVVFPYGGIEALVTHQQTGWVVHSEAEYTHALAFLYSHPEERQRLGENARRHVRKTFDPQSIVQELARIFQHMQQQPKRQRAWPTNDKRPAAWFVQALGTQGGPFAISLNEKAWPSLLSADEAIAKASVNLRGGEGGIIHYRNHYPHDSHLRLWTGLVLEEQGHEQKALAEYTAAVELGFDHWRAHWYIARIAQKLQQPQLALQAAQVVVQKQCDFGPGHALLKKFTQ
jgi:glycosyltransferase involved in cell wall biosynthesis